MVLAMQPDPAMLRGLFEQALARREQQYGMLDARTAQAAHDLGMFLHNQQDDDGARRALTEALRVDEKTRGLSAARTLSDAADLASVSPPEQAEPLWQRAAKSGDAALAARSLAALGELREAQGDRAGAAGFYRQALAKQEAVRGKDDAQVAVRLNELALVENPRAGVVLLQRALAIDRRAWGERHPETATAETNLSGLLLATGKIAESVRIAKAALATFESTLGPDHPRTAVATSNLADALRAARDYAGAERMYRRALAIDEAVYGPNRPETQSDVQNLADFLRERGRNQEAQELERRLPVSGAPR